MENTSTDRTGELEQRLKAIRIFPEDSCVFFERREGCAMGFPRCRYCRFAKFEPNAEYEKQGLCKFKK